MIKKIHYVWVGGKPLPRLAKKCIKSWKKYLPDWEIIEWNEKNFDIENSVPFVKEAYAQKKWAFVADYIRTQALYEHGGIYFDTDMEVLGDISKFLEQPAFLGREYEGDEKEMVCAGVMYFAKKHDPFLREMLDFYEGVKQFNTGLMYSYAIPKIITRILDKYKRRVNDDGIEVFNDRIWVYPKDYFYPVNYDWTKEFYSENTVMIHHYDASWTGSSNKRNVAIRKVLPKPMSSAVLYSLGLGSRIKHGLISSVREANTKLRTKASIYVNVKRRLQELSTSIDKFNNNNFLVFSNPNWVGMSHVAEDMLGGYVPIRDIHTFKQREIDEIARMIIDANKSSLIFNGLVAGWDRVIEAIKQADESTKIKILYHGGDVRLARPGDYTSFMKILGLHNMGLVDQIGFAKKQQAEFYKSKGYRAKFVANNVHINNPSKYKRVERSKAANAISIGLYCSGDVEWKNVFNQVAAASLVDGAELDVVPINQMVAGYADKIQARVTGSDKILPRGELLTRMAGNDVNLYVSFAEASPLLPLESMELGVPCVTANNHHYWTDTPLEEYLIVDRPDDIMAIHSQVEKALKNRVKIMKLYKEWKAGYNTVSKKSVEDFIKT